MKKFVRKLQYDVMDFINTVIQPDTEFIKLLKDFDAYNAKVPYPATDENNPMNYEKINSPVKLSFAYLNPDPVGMIQFSMICKFKVQIGSGERAHLATRYMLIAAANFSLVSLQSYVLSRKDGLRDEYFRELISQPVIFTEEVFNDWLIHSANLSFIKGKDTYWKDPNNAKKLAQAINDINSTNHTR